MPPDPVPLHALKAAPAEKIRRALHSAMDVLADGQDWLEIERLLREHLGVQEALRILEPIWEAPPPKPTSPSVPPSPRRRRR